MPELPEMENYKRLLTDLILHKTITQVEINREKSINLSVQHFIDEVKNHTITKIERRAKHLLFYLENGKIMLLHLMLGGWMFYGTDEEKPDRTVQIKLSFKDKHLYFIGLRLGYLHLLTCKEVERQLQDLGPEPLEENFTVQKFEEIISKKRGILKTTLTNQKVLSGIGNCYSDEICFTASLLPTRTGTNLEQTEIEHLYLSMKQVLKEATEKGGYMASPLYKKDQLTGGYDSQCKVYDRGSEPCVRCGNPIIKEKISSRKVFYCRVCQH